MRTQDPIKRTLITTALAFTLSILSWYIQAEKAVENRVKLNTEASNQASNSVVSTSINK